jgi:hypothetical protein
MDDERPVGFVLASRIERHHRRVDEALVPLGSGNVVSADASVGDLMDWIIRPGFLFVLEGREVTGFITVHDFNKQPARGHLYLLLARLESDLARLVRFHYRADSEASLPFLSDPAQSEIRQRFADDVNADVDSDLFAYFDLSDLVRLVGRDETLRARIPDMTKGRWRSLSGGLVELRNQVMHPVRNVVLTKSGLETLHRRERRTRELIAMVEDAIERAKA